MNNFLKLGFIHYNLDVHTLLEFSLFHIPPAARRDRASDLRGSRVLESTITWFFFVFTHALRGGSRRWFTSLLSVARWFGCRFTAEIWGGCVRLKLSLETRVLSADARRGHDERPHVT